MAMRPDVSVGPVLVSPSRRLIEGPGGSIHLEPLIMQVFLLLLDADGAVVTRTELFEQCWGGVYVGDDSLNRAVAKVRQATAEVAPGLFEIETIPRTGYRLVGDWTEPASAGGEPRAAAHVPRRAVIGGGLALAGIAGAGFLWRSRNAERDFARYMAEGEAVLDYGDAADQAAGSFAQALESRPDDPRALGLLAYALATRVDDRQPGRANAGLADAQTALRSALAVDPAEPNARLAQILLERSTLDLAGNEDRLRAVLASDPTNVQVMRNLWNLLQCAGRSREAHALVEQAIAMKPLAASNNYPRAQLLWILGREPEAERIIDRALHYWPTHRWVRFARFIIFTFTGRERAALAMLNGRDTAPQIYSPEAIALWRVSLAALEDRSGANVAAAREANVAAAKQMLRLASQAIMTLSALGEIDAAFEVANALLIFRPPGAAPQATQQRAPKKSTAWIFAPWLFTPPLARMRADPRFRTLCEGIGLTDYWTRRGRGPDFPIGIA